MAPPAFLASSFGYTSLPTMTDFTQAIAAFQAMVLAQSPAWTESPAGTFISPPDGSGRFFEVRLIRATAFQLNVRIRNQFGVVISDRSLNMPGPTHTTRIYAGQFHAVIECDSINPQCAGGGLLDQSARPQTSQANYVYGFGYHDAGFGYDGQGDSAAQYFALDNGVPAVAPRALHIATAAAWGVPLIHGSGFTEHVPVKLSAQMASLIRRIGRLYQHFWVDNSFPVGAEIPIPVDTSPPTTGIFRVLNRSDTYVTARIACRIA